MKTSVAVAMSCIYCTFVCDYDSVTSVIRRTYSNIGTDVLRLPAQSCETAFQLVLGYTDISYEQSKQLLKTFIWALRSWRIVIKLLINARSRTSARSLINDGVPRPVF